MISQYLSNLFDLNLIENIWCYIKKKIAKDYAYIISEDEIMRMIKQIWDDYLDDFWDNLIFNILNRMQVMIDIKRESMSY